MDGSEQRPVLKFLHADEQLVSSKLRQFERVETEELIESLLPGKAGALKTRNDGTVIDGHHRLKVLINRGIDVNALPREVIPKQEA